MEPAPPTTSVETLPSSLRYDGYIYIYKYTHGLHCVSNTLSKVDIEPITKGHKYKLKKLRCCTSVRQHFFPPPSLRVVYTTGTRCCLRLLTRSYPCRLLRDYFGQDEKKKKKERKKKKKKKKRKEKIRKNH